MHRVLFDSDLLFLDFAFFCPESQARLKRCASLPVPVTPPDSESDPPPPQCSARSRPVQGRVWLFPPPCSARHRLRSRRLSASCSHRLPCPTRSHLRGEKLPRAVCPRRGSFGLVSCERAVTGHLCPPRAEAECSHQPINSEDRGQYLAFLAVHRRMAVTAQ